MRGNGNGSDVDVYTHTHQSTRTPANTRCWRYEVADEYEWFLEACVTVRFDRPACGERCDARMYGAMCDDGSAAAADTTAPSNVFQIYEVNACGVQDAACSHRCVCAFNMKPSHAHAAEPFVYFVRLLLHGIRF